MNKIFFSLIILSNIFYPKNIFGETIEDKNNYVFKAWCGEIEKFEKFKDRPSCEIKFEKEYMLISNILRISNNQLLSTKLNYVCTQTMLQDQCAAYQWFGMTRETDKRYTFKYKQSNGNLRKGIITMRDYKSDKMFREAFKKWSKVELIIGDLIKESWLEK